MATLTSILAKRTRFGESTLERGRVWIFTPGSQFNQFVTGCFCWFAPGTGTAIIEAWGAAGSGARMCCCGAGLPGNPGAYVKKCVNVTSGNWIRGITGMSCGNADALCFRGCSQSTCVTICLTGTCCCLCAQGGRGGITYCTTDPGSPYCCFFRDGYTATHLGDCCGIVCNFRPANNFNPARAFGGDINKDGGWSCTTFLANRGGQVCCYIYNVKTSPYIFTEEGTSITHNSGSDFHTMTQNGGSGWGTTLNLSIAGRQPTSGGLWGPNACWQGTRLCGCYEANGCLPYMPYGVPGTPANPSADVRDQGWRGGHGLVRIKFIGT